MLGQTVFEYKALLLCGTRGSSTGCSRLYRSGCGRLVGVVLTLILLSPCVVLGDSVPQKFSSAESPAGVVFDDVMSPYCPGRTLSACPSNDARVLRQQISSWVANGESAEQVKQKLVDLYGVEILGIPQGPVGIVLGWMAPVIALAAGLWAIWLMISGRTGSRGPARTGAESRDDSACQGRLLAKADAELKKWRMDL